MLNLLENVNFNLHFHSKVKFRTESWVDINKDSGKCMTRPVKLNL